MWYKAHTFLMTLLLILHSTFSLVLSIMILFTILSSATYTVCGKYSEFSIVSYFLLNLSFGVLYFMNLKNAKEMDIALLKKSRNLLFLGFVISPILFIGAFAPKLICGDKQNRQNVIISTSKIVAHLMIEFFFVGIYFAFYLRHVAKKEIFTRPYDTGIKI